MSASLNSFFHAHYFQSVSPCLQTGLPCHCQIHAAPSSACLQHRATENPQKSSMQHTLSSTITSSITGPSFSLRHNYEPHWNAVSAGRAVLIIKYCNLTQFWYRWELQKKKRKQGQLTRSFAFKTCIRQNVIFCLPCDTPNHDISTICGDKALRTELTFH